MAGIAHHAVEALAWFKPYVQAPNFEATWASAMSAKVGLDFVALIARWHSGAPELYLCDGQRADRVRPGRPVIIGSVRDDERTILETRTRVLLVRGNRPHMIQLGVCALLVWRAFNEVGFKDNIGGTPASISVNAEGTAWMPDMSVYAVDVRPGPGSPRFHDMIHRVSIIGRDHVVAVASTHTNQTRLLTNPMTAEMLSDWRDKWLDEVLTVARQNTVKLVALVALIQRRLAVLELDRCQGKYVLVKSDEIKFGDELTRFFLGPPPTLPGGAVYSIPLGEPAALAMVESGGPRDAYDIDLGISFMITVSEMDKNFDAAFRVWESMVAGFATHRDILTAGLIAMENEPGAPRLDCVLAAWEQALAVDPSLIEQARFVATKHPDHPEVARRLLAAAAKAEAATTPAGS